MRGPGGRRTPAGSCGAFSVRSSSDHLDTQGENGAWFISAPSRVTMRVAGVSLRRVAGVSLRDPGAQAAKPGPPHCGLRPSRNHYGTTPNPGIRQSAETTGLVGQAR